MKLKNDVIASQMEKMLTSAMIGKFKSQGHNLTGKGIQSIKTVVRDNIGGLIIQITGEDYMGYQDSGTKAGSRNSSGGWIEALTSWVQRRGIESDMKKAKSIAFAIAKTHIKVGMHTRRGKLDMSKRHFISSSVEKASPAINKMLFQMFDKNFDLFVTNLTSKNQKTILNIN